MVKQHSESSWSVPKAIVVTFVMAAAIVASAWFHFCVFVNKPHIGDGNGGLIFVATIAIGSAAGAVLYSDKRKGLARGAIFGLAVFCSSVFFLIVLNTIFD